MGCQGNYGEYGVFGGMGDRGGGETEVEYIIVLGGEI